MAIEIVVFPIKNGDFPVRYVSLPEGMLTICGWSPAQHLDFDLTPQHHGPWVSKRHCYGAEMSVPLTTPQPASNAISISLMIQ